MLRESSGRVLVLARIQTQQPLADREVQVEINLHAGDATATIWTNDLTHDYVHENSAYST